MPPVSDPPAPPADDEDASLDVRSDTFGGGLRGMACCRAPAAAVAVAVANAGNCPGSDAGGPSLAGGEADARWAGFLATGGAGLAGRPATVGGAEGSEVGAAGKDSDLARAGCGGACMAVCLLGGGGGGPSFFGLRDIACSSVRLSRPTLVGNPAGSYGGGSFLGAELDADVDSRVEWLICS